MTEPHTEPTLDDVLVPSEDVRPDHHEHAKLPRPVDDDDLEHRAEHEREVTGAGGPVDDE
jgi:hypothetical protein